MKIATWVVMLLITAIIIVYLYYKPAEHGDKPQPQQQINVKVDLDTDLLDRVQELTRQNVWLQQENDDLKNQIKEFSWLKEGKQ